HIGTNHCHPKMNISQRIIHIPAIHFRKPVINPGKHTHEGSYPHHKMKVGYIEISIMQVKIECGITQPYTCKTTGNKHTYKPHTEKHSRCEPDISPPQCCK